MIRPPGISRHPLESVHAEIFTKIQNRRVGVAVVVVLLGVYSYRKLQALAADPTGEKDCGPAVGGGEQAKIDLERIKAIAPLKDVKVVAAWRQHQ
jgi:hypothetical protein